MRSFMGFIVGGLFGAGLLISGMTDTQKVQGWLDFFGDWDPTLAFVMGGAILPMAVAWRLTIGRKPLLKQDFSQLPDSALDRKIIVGSVMFGIGWALVGLCPGPAIASLGFGGLGGFVFLVTMILGMLIAPKLRAALD
jgi:uncharacterized membrane protein YedE/YeeE